MYIFYIPRSLPKHEYLNQDYFLLSLSLPKNTYLSGFPYYLIKENGWKILSTIPNISYFDGHSPLAEHAVVFL